MIPRNLYDDDDFFRLIIRGVTTQIEEPIGWDKVRIRGTRDQDLFGLNYEFVDAKTTLTFPDHQGREVIMAAYEAYGIDEEIVFEYGYVDNEIGEKLVQFRGKLNLSDNSRDDDGLDCTIEKVVFLDKLRTRYETKVKMTDTVDLDGNTIVPPAPIVMSLHSRKIEKVAKAGPDPANNPSVETDFASNSQYNHIQPPTDNPIISELETMFNMPIACTRLHPRDEDRFQFTAATNGLSVIRFKAAFTVTAHIFPSGIPDVPGIPSNIGNFFQLQPFIIIERAGNIMQQFQDPSFYFIHNSGFVHEIKHAFDITVTVNLQVGDNIYCNVGFLKPTSNNVTIHDWDGFISVDQITELPATTANVWRLWDVVQFLMLSLTGRTDGYVSSFFGPGGCGYNYFLTNGYQVRNFDVTERPMQISLKDCYENMKAIWCSGTQNSITADGKDIVKLERIKSLFGSKRIYEFVEVFDYTDSHVKADIYNEVEIGYTKYPEDEVNTLDEYNTLHNYLLPLASYKQKYTQKCTWIASGYLLEEQRREQFDENPSTSVTNDDDNFIIAGIGGRIYKGISYWAGNTNRVRFPGDRVLLQVGDVIGITNDTSGTPNNIDATVILITDVNQNEYELSEDVNPTTGIIDLRVSTFGIVAERNEAFQTVTGVVSADSSYNLRITPKRMLYNHSEILMAGLELKDDSKIIKNTGVKDNGDLVTKFSDFETCMLTAENYQLREVDDIVLSNFNAKNVLWMPRQSTFKTKMTYRDLVALKTKLTGQANTDEDYGLVSWPDLDGRYWEGYIWSFEYDPYLETLEVVTRKKRRIL